MRKHRIITMIVFFVVSALAAACVESCILFQEQFGMTVLEAALAQKQFSLVEIEGYQISSQDEENGLLIQTAAEASEVWFQEYTDNLKGIGVPLKDRILEGEILSTELLQENSAEGTDGQESYVQLDYTISASGTIEDLVNSLELIPSGNSDGLYTGQIVLHWQLEDGVWTILESMQPVHYQLRFYDEQADLAEYQEQAAQAEENSSAEEAFLADADFVSETEDRWYRADVIESALGSKLYQISWSEDGEEWTILPDPDYQFENLTFMTWLDDLTGYIGTGRTLLVTLDGGESFQSAQWEIPSAVTETLGFNPYDTPEQVYQEGDTVYLVVGQGDDADYKQDGLWMKALFSSADQVTFSFVEEFGEAGETEPG